MEAIIESLHTRGYRVTDERKKVVKKLKSSVRLLSAYEIAEETHVDTVTVYRVLELLEKEGFIHKSNYHSAYYVCSVDSQDKCHQTITCKNCKSYEELPLDEHSHPKAKKFKIPKQTHELLATCNQCS